jgi:hypothetical protein
MKPLEKKLFALNVVNGGSWSRMVARVGKINFESLVNNRNQAAPRHLISIEVTIPPGMRDRKLDLFLVNIDPNTKKAMIGLNTKIVGEKENIRFPAQKNQKQYFVIIEPSQPLCIYNQVR